MATIVFFHAHPDDEALLTAGTMRALHEAGHTIVLVVATNGEAGLTDPHIHSDLSAIRMHELATSASILGVSKTHWLGYADSGLDGTATSTTATFCQTDIEQAALRLAEYLVDIKADMIVGYDQKGGYGHPDHVRVHHVAHRAAVLAGTEFVFEATADRATIARLLEVMRPLISILKANEVMALADGFTPRADITHTVDVSHWLGPKKAAMKAHASQAVGGSTPRSLQVFVKLPKLIFKKAFGREWFKQTHGDHTNNPIAKLPQF
jgi:LmbE family N-acetylglucosaminyl deacetylase